MAKRLIFIFSIIAAAIGLNSCTHNNGDIGPLFGSWVLEEMTVNGDKTVPDVDGDTFLQFQGGVIMAKLIDDRHSLLFYSVGSWEREGDVLIVNYTHSDNQTPQGEGQYMAPYWLMLTTNAINRITILSLDKKAMRLEYITPDGDTVRYLFRKTF